MTSNQYQEKRDEILEKFMYSFTHLDDPMDMDQTGMAIDTLFLELIGEDEPVIEGRSLAHNEIAYQNQQENRFKAELRQVIQGDKS